MYNNDYEKIDNIELMEMQKKNSYFFAKAIFALMLRF